VEWVVGRRRLRQAGEQGGLRERQLRSVPREVGLRSRLDPVRVVAVVDLVHVGGQDPLLRPGARQLDGEARLFELALDRPLLRHGVEVADELLRDRRAALDDLARADVLVESAGDADGVHTAVRVEPAVLDRNGRARHPRADLRAGDGLAIALGRNRAEQRAVTRVDERVRADLDRPQRLQVAARVESDGTSESSRGQRDRNDDEQDGGDPARAALVALTPAVALARAPRGEDRIIVGTAAPRRRRRAHPKTPAARRR